VPAGMAEAVTFWTSFTAERAASATLVQFIITIAACTAPLWESLKVAPRALLHHAGIVQMSAPGPAVLGAVSAVWSLGEHPNHFVSVLRSHQFAVESEREVLLVREALVHLAAAADEEALGSKGGVQTDLSLRHAFGHHHPVLQEGLDNTVS